MARIETHLHTAECDKCVSICAKDIVSLYKEAGYDGIVITDHYFALSAEWFGIEQTEKNHKAFIDRWLEGYRNAKEAADELGMTVLLGAEVRFDGKNINDYLIYGLTEEFFYNAPYLNKLDGLPELLKYLPEGAVAVQAHPFRDAMTVADPSQLFGIEVHNGGTDKKRNALAEQFAELYGKRKLSGSDFHARAHLARGGIEAELPINNSEDFIRTLREGKYTLIK